MIRSMYFNTMLMPLVIMPWLLYVRWRIIGEVSGDTHSCMYDRPIQICSYASWLLAGQNTVKVAKVFFCSPGDGNAVSKKWKIKLTTSSVGLQAPTEKPWHSLHILYIKLMRKYGPYAQ